MLLNPYISLAEMCSWEPHTGQMVLKHMNGHPFAYMTLNFDLPVPIQTKFNQIRISYRNAISSNAIPTMSATNLK